MVALFILCTLFRDASGDHLVAPGVDLHLCKNFHPPNEILDLAMYQSFPLLQERLCWLKRICDDACGVSQAGYSNLVEYDNPTVVGIECDDLAREARPGFTHEPCSLTTATRTWNSEVAFHEVKN